MRSFRLSKRLLVAVLCAACGGVLHGQEQNRVEIAAMARMARAKFSSIITAEKLKAGDSYRAQVVFAARSSELRPTDKSAAVRLLNLMPEDDAQHATWMMLGDGLCNGESLDDMKSLGRLGERLPRNLAKAVLLAPEKMPGYVAYASFSVQDLHRDYAVQMESVCRAKHREFVKAVESLPTDKHDWFVRRVPNPDGCHALALPEAE